MTRLLLAFAVVAMVSNQALAAAKSVTLLGVTGPGGDKLASQLESDLGDLYEVVPGEAYRATADELELPGASADEVKAVATKLRIDAVIGASVTGIGRGRILAIAVREGATGRVLARGKYELTGPRVLKDRVVADLVRALEMATSMRSSSRKHGDDDESAFAPNGETASVKRRAPARERAVAGFSLNVGPSLLTRSLAIDGAGAPAYNAGTLVGLRITGGFFPFALSTTFANNHPVLASFGVLGSFEYIFANTVNTPDGSSQGHGLRGDVRLAGRIPLGHGAVGGYLQVETGYQKITFTNDLPDLVGVPNASYDIVVAGLQWDRLLGVPWAMLALHFRALAPLGAGDLVAAESYGRASAFGIDAGGGLTFLPLRWMTVRLEADYTRIGLEYKGTGTLVAKSSVDQIPSGALSIGFAL